MRERLGIDSSLSKGLPHLLPEFCSTERDLFLPQRKFKFMPHTTAITMPRAREVTRGAGVLSLGVQQHLQEGSFSSTHKPSLV